eukprot:1771660-Rhodomonas_salina.2
MPLWPVVALWPVYGAVARLRHCGRFTAPYGCITVDQTVCSRKSVLPGVGSVPWAVPIDHDHETVLLVGLCSLCVAGPVAMLLIARLTAEPCDCLQHCRVVEEVTAGSRKQGCTMQRRPSAP